MNCGVCECVSVLYKYNIILYNLIIRKYRGFVTLTYIYICVLLSCYNNFCYKVSDSRKRKKKICKVSVYFFEEKIVL